MNSLSTNLKENDHISWARVISGQLPRCSGNMTKEKEYFSNFIEGKKPLESLGRHVIEKL